MPAKKPYVVNSNRTWLQAQKDLERLFRKWGVTEFDISRETDGSCTVTWYPAGANKTVELKSSDQPEPRLNMVKLFLGIEAMELAERRGLASIASSYYAQTTALVEHESTRTDRYAPYAVLDVSVTAPQEVVDAAYKAKINRAHSDKGGNDADAARINVAKDAIYAERGWR